MCFNAGEHSKLKQLNIFFSDSNIHVSWELSFRNKCHGIQQPDTVQAAVRYLE
jgi:hypothetical protein